MRESNELEKLDVCITKIKFINTCLISVFKSKGFVTENKEPEKGMSEWKLQIRKSKELLERFFKEYLPSSRDQTKPITIKQSAVMPESLRNSSRCFEEVNQCIEFTFVRIEETKDGIYELLIDLYSRTRDEKCMFAVHRKLRPALRNETIRWLDKQPLEKCMQNVKNFYFEYWKDVMRGEIICLECKSTMAYHEGEGCYLPPIVIENRKDSSRSYYHDKCYERRRTP